MWKILKLFLVLHGISLGGLGSSIISYNAQNSLDPVAVSTGLHSAPLMCLVNGGSMVSLGSK